MSRLVRTVPAVPVLAVAALLGAAAAGARTITVDTTLDADAADGVCSLREAILAANDDVARNECPGGSGADRIVFNVPPPGIIILTDHLPTITDTLAIVGPGATELALDGDTFHRPLTLDTPGNDGWLLVTDLSITHGRAPSGESGGGARVAAGDTATFRRVRFIGNRAENGGGGLVVESGSEVHSTVSLVDCLFVDNVAEGAAGGGGLLTSGTGNVVHIEGSTFFGNSAAHANGVGGGMRLTRAIVDMLETTVTGNVANSSGGGIFVSTDPAGGATLVVRDSTIVENTAGADPPGGDGGGIRAAPGVDHPLDLLIQNTVVADNLDLATPFEPDLSCGPNLTALWASGSDLVGSNEGCAAHFPAGLPNAFGDFVGTAAAPLAPELEALAFHGGPTPTHRPSESPPSPLVDQGTCPGAVADQRGHGDPAAHLRRVDLAAVPNAAGGDGCDIGAFEVQGEPGADPAIFADGFELGHTLLWSREVQ